MHTDGGDDSPEGDNLSGRLRIAMPNIGDPRFERSVIFMFAHSRAGARGLIINRPTDDVSFVDLLDQLKLEHADDIEAPPVRFGGPVEVERGFVLHSPDYHRDEATVRVDSTFALTATVDVLRAIAEGAGPKRSLFALGYAGWGPGQLEREILSNGWLHCESDPDIVYGDDDDEKWTQALAKIGVSASMLSSTAGSA